MNCAIGCPTGGTAAAFGRTKSDGTVRGSGQVGSVSLGRRCAVKPCVSLSLQMHHHRAGHRAVVCCAAKGTAGDEVLILLGSRPMCIQAW